MLTAGVAGGCDERSDAGPTLRPLPDLPEVAEIIDSSMSFRSRMGDDIGYILEGRFLGDHIVTLHRDTPHLRLFAADGRPLWVGGRGGSGPLDFVRPQAIAAGADSTLLVFEQGRVSEWRLAADTLAFRAAHALPARHFPLGAIAGCRGDWLLYSRDQEMYDTVTWQVEAGPDVDWLQSLRLTPSGVELRPLWSQPRNANTLSLSGHAAVLIGRTDSQIVVLHRAASWSGGEILEFDCAGRVVRSRSERPLIHGDSLPVQLPRERANQWTAGIVALGDGWILPLNRFFSSRAFDTGENSVYKTEVFYSEGGELLGSVILPGQWLALDYHPDHGVLLAESRPPHVVRMPLSALRPTGQERASLAAAWPLARSGPQ